jgi:hypothetical protein
MKAICNFRQFNTMTKQSGSVASVWLAVNSLGHSDRTPEGYISSGFLEGSGYA